MKIVIQPCECTDVHYNHLVCAKLMNVCSGILWFLFVENNQFDFYSIYLLRPKQANMDGAGTTGRQGWQQNS